MQCSNDEIGVDDQVIFVANKARARLNEADENGTSWRKCGLTLANVSGGESNAELML